MLLSIKHFFATNKSLLYLIIIGAVFAGCGTQNKFASSFGKRHYTKGFYVDVPGTIQKSERDKAVLTAEKMPIITSAQIVSKSGFQQPDIHSATIAQSALTKSSHKKITEIIPVHAIIAQPLIVDQLVGITPAVDKEEKSVNNIHAIISFLAAVGIIAITSLLAILFVANASLVTAIWLVGAIIAIALDALAVYFAIQAYTKKEADTGGSLIVLIINGIILLVGLLGYIRNARK